MTNLDSVLKSKDIPLPTKVCIVKVMVFPLSMYGYKSWTTEDDWVWVKVTQSCPALCDPMDYTFYGILQDRILERVAVPFSKGSSQPRDQTWVSSTAGRFFTSWATREAQHQRIDAFEMWCCRILLRVPWTGRRSNQSILNEINPEYSLEGLMLKLKLQYFGHLMRRANSLEKMLILGKIESRRRGDRGWDGWMASPIQWTWVSANSERWWGTGKPGVPQFMGSQRVGHNLVTAKQTCKVCNCSRHCSSGNDQQVASDSHNPTRRTSRLQFSHSVCSTLCDPMNRSTPGLPVHHQLPESTQTHVHRVGDAIQPSHPLSPPSPPAPNPSQHQGLFQWVNSSHEVAKILQFHLQHQSFQWTPRTDLL